MKDFLKNIDKMPYDSGYPSNKVNAINAHIDGLAEKPSADDIHSMLKYFQTEDQKVAAIKKCIDKPGDSYRAGDLLGVLSMRLSSDTGRQAVIEHHTTKLTAKPDKEALNTLLASVNDANSKAVIFKASNEKPGDPYPEKLVGDILNRMLNDEAKIAIIKSHMGKQATLPDLEQLGSLAKHISSPINKIELIKKTIDDRGAAAFSPDKLIALVDKAFGFNEDLYKSMVAEHYLGNLDSKPEAVSIVPVLNLFYSNESKADQVKKLIVKKGEPYDVKNITAFLGAIKDDRYDPLDNKLKILKAHIKALATQGTKLDGTSLVELVEPIKDHNKIHLVQLSVKTAAAPYQAKDLGVILAAIPESDHASVLNDHLNRKDVKKDSETLGALANLLPQGDRRNAFIQASLNRADVKIDAKMVMALAPLVEEGEARDKFITETIAKHQVSIEATILAPLMNMVGEAHKTTILNHHTRLAVAPTVQRNEEKSEEYKQQTVTRPMPAPTRMAPVKKSGGWISCCTALPPEPALAPHGTGPRGR